MLLSTEDSMLLLSSVDSNMYFNTCCFLQKIAITYNLKIVCSMFFWYVTLSFNSCELRNKVSDLFCLTSGHPWKAIFVLIEFGFPRQKCDPTRANEALWGKYQNWHFKFNMLFNIQGTFWHQNDFHIIFLSKVIDNLISNCLITLNINYQDMDSQRYWFENKPIEHIKKQLDKT